MPESSSPPETHSHHHEKFSLPLFALTVALSLAGLLGALRWLAPSLWQQELQATWPSAVFAFLAVSLFNCFMEYFFHRYALHTPAIGFLRRLYRQHTLHHALTRVTRRRARDQQSMLVIENKFPIAEPEQGEASFFPWYSLAVFALCLSPVLYLLHLLLPTVPWFLAGFAALANSLILYEVLHSINHWPFERWVRLVQHPRWGGFWRPVYGFHLRHHAVTDCNESVSGFFGLPLADWLFRTCIIPPTLYPEGQPERTEDFASPRPVAFIRWLDRRAEQAVQRRRLAAAQSPQAKSGRSHTPAEEIANWVTHGIGLILSVVGLTLLIVYSSLRGDAWHVVSFTVFGLALLLLYTVSTLYHAQREGRRRAVFQRLDHAAIFIAIAGTYTPFLLTHLRGPWGWTLFGVVWGLCGAGAIFKLVAGPRYALASVIMYLFTGWLVLIALKPLVANVPAGSVWLLVAGGLSYTIGVVFYRWQRLRFHHAVWHLFVLGGSTCHFLAVFLFLLPPGSGV